MRTLKKLEVYNNFNDLRNDVQALAETESTVIWDRGMGRRSIDTFSDEGLTNAGTIFDIPSKFMIKNRNLSPDHRYACQHILDLKMEDYLAQKKTVMFRDWNGITEGVCSSKYGIFDDYEVMDILETNPYFTDCGQIWGYETPDKFHARFISENTLNVPGDRSPLHMALFVTNSMTGGGAINIKFGVYRAACTNGMIWGLKEFSIVRQIHKSDTEFADILDANLQNVAMIEDTLTKRINGMIEEKSSIYDFKTEIAVDYLKSKLGIGGKFSEAIYQKYLEYGGQSKWDLTNAITDKAHDLDINSRLRLETLALKVA